MAHHILKLGLVKGAGELANEVISLKLSSSNERANKKRNITIFFGGDVQDEPEAMKSHRDHGRYLKWNLLNIATLLSLKFPASSLFVIKPSRMELRTFSCYDNFVKSNTLGVPTHEDMGTGLEHLKNLVENSLKELLRLSENDENEQKNLFCKEPHVEDLNITDEIESINIIGFSKGCVVINQLIIEAYSISNSLSDENEHLKIFWSKVQSLYLLDGGHSGGKDTWITRKNILNALASNQNISIHVHVSPYQVKDDRRPWIGKECKLFVDILKRANADIHYKLHFADEIPSLENHFRILEDFKPNFEDQK